MKDLIIIIVSSVFLDALNNGFIANRAQGETEIKSEIRQLVRYRNNRLRKLTNATVT